MCVCVCACNNTMNRYNNFTFEVAHLKMKCNFSPVEITFLHNAILKFPSTIWLHSKFYRDFFVLIFQPRPPYQAGKKRGGCVRRWRLLQDCQPSTSSSKYLHPKEMPPLQLHFLTAFPGECLVFPACWDFKTRFDKT